MPCACSAGLEGLPDARRSAARKAHYVWAGITREIVKKFDAERKRRAKTIRKLAKELAR